MTEHEKAENIRTLALSLSMESRVLSFETAEKTATDLINSADGWKPWSDTPTEMMVIVGKDCLGFVHNATHLIGSKDGQWVEEWKRVLI